MKLSGLIDALIAAGGTMEQVRAVVAAAERADEERRTTERAEREEKLAAARESARLRQRKSRASRDVTPVTCDNRDKDAPVHEGTLAHPEITKLTTTDTDKTPPTEGQKPKSKAPRKTRIASDAQPTEADRKTADRLGMDLPTFRHEWAKFRDHHAAFGTLMENWSSGWSKWARGWVDRQPRTGNPARAGPQRSGNSTFGAMDRLMNGIPSDEPGYHPRSDRNGPEILVAAKRIA